MSAKVISLKKYKNRQKLNKFKNKKMLLLVIIIAAIIALLMWNYFVENSRILDVQIPPSQNITYNNTKCKPLTMAQLANEFEQNDDKPILLHLYTSWCKICTKNMPIFNDIAREFQNSDIKIIAIAIDKNIDEKELHQYLNKYGNIYFEPNFLISKKGFAEFLAKRNIRYSGRIPYTTLIDKNGEILFKYTGLKNKKYLRKEIIKAVFLDD